MRRTTHLLLAIGVAGLAVLAQPQEVSAQSDNSAIAASVTVNRAVVLDACGEMITIPATVHIKLIDQKSENGHTVTTWHVRGTGEAVGSNGNRYLWKENTLLSNRRNGNNQQFVTDLNQRSRLIGKGKAPNRVFTLRMHMTFNANGDLTARVYGSDVQCR